MFPAKRSLRNISVTCLLLFLLTTSTTTHSQPRLQVWAERYDDEFDNSFYPILNADLSYKSFQITYWSSVDQGIYPYVNIIYNWRSWAISINPLKPDIYNYTI